MEANIKNCGCKIDLAKQKEEKLRVKLDTGKIDHAKYHKKKGELDRDMIALNARIHTLQGGILKERRRIKEDRGKKKNA